MIWWQYFLNFLKFLDISENRLRFYMISACVYNRNNNGNAYAHKILNNIRSKKSKNTVENLLNTHKFKSISANIQLSRKFLDTLTTKTPHKDGHYPAHHFLQSIKKYVIVVFITLVFLFLIGTVYTKEALITAVILLGWTFGMISKNQKLRTLRTSFQMSNLIELCEKNDPNSIWNLFLTPISLGKEKTISLLPATHYNKIIYSDSVKNIFQCFKTIEQGTELNEQHIKALAHAMDHCTQTDDLDFLSQFRNSKQVEKSYNLSSHSSFFAPLVLYEINLVLYKFTQGRPSLQKKMNETKSEILSQLEISYKNFTTLLIKHIKEHYPNKIPFLIKESIETTNAKQFYAIKLLAEIFTSTKIFQHIELSLLKNQEREAIEEGIIMLQAKFIKGNSNIKIFEDLLLSLPIALLQKLEAANV